MHRPQITAVNHYDVFPFDHGGSLGIRGLYKAMSEWFDVNIITFVTHDPYPEKVKISNHVTVIPIVLPAELTKKQYELYEEYGMGKDTLVDSSPAVMRWYHEYPEIIDRVREISSDSVLVLAEHVFTWKIIKKACPDKHLWYRANNVEFDYKKTIYETIGSPKDLLDETYEFEKECCMECEKVLTVSQLEADRFMELYGFPEVMRKKFMDIHSGFDTDDLHTVLPGKRAKVSEKYLYFGLFIASNTPNALEAAKICIEIARECPDIKIFLVGRVKKQLANETNIPENIEIMGLVSDEEKVYLLQHCDFALNPMENGAGINVKMFEYFAYGIPVITTAYGARGIDLTDGQDCVLTSRGHYTEDVRDFCALEIGKKDAMAKKALELLERRYSWRSLAGKITEEIERMYGTSYQKFRLPLEEIALYGFALQEPCLPEGQFYIRCAGNNGRKCLAFLRSVGKEPEAFVEIDPDKIGKTVDGVSVISLNKFLSEMSEAEIIVAVWEWFDIAAGLLASGIPEERLLISWGDTGQAIFRVSDLKGRTHRYFDARKWKKNLLLRVEELKRNDILQEGSHSSYGKGDSD